MATLPRALLASALLAAPAAMGAPVVKPAAGGMSWPAAVAGTFRGMGRLNPNLELPALVNLSRLDYGVSHNAARLEPVIWRLELSAPAFPLKPEAFAALPAAEQRALLVEAVSAARKDANERAQKLVNALQFGIKDPQAARFYREAEQLVLVESPYVAPAFLPKLKEALPKLLARKKAHEESVRRERRRAAERAAEAGRALEEDARRWDTGAAYEDKPSGPTELDRELSRSADEWDGRFAPESEHPNERQGLRQSAGESGFGDERPEYPLSHVRSAYLGPARRAAEAADSASFWRLADSAFASLEDLVADELLVLRQIGRLGPRGRERVRALREQASRLKTELRRLKARNNLPGGYRSRYARRGEPVMDGLEGGEAAVHRRIAALEARLDRRNWRERERGWSAAVEADRLREEGDGSMVGPLLEVADYYRARLRQGDADSDAAHIAEILRNLVYGRRPRWAGGSAFPPLAAVRAIWGYARSQPENHRPLAARAALGLAAAAALGWALWVFPAGGLVWALVAAGATGALAYSWRAIARLGRFLRLDREFAEVAERARRAGI